MLPAASPRCCCGAAASRRPGGGSSVAGVAAPPRRGAVRCRAGSRSEKDAARDHLHIRTNIELAAGPLAGVLNWLSQNAFGAGTGGWHVGALYRRWLQQRGTHLRQQRDRSAAGAPGAGAAASAEVVRSLAVLMLVSEHRVRQLADRWPQLVELEQDFVAQRLLLLKRVLPACDVARMIELAPGPLLGCDAAVLTDVVAPRVAALAAGMPGADIAGMVQEEPVLLFEELEPSLPRLHELWPGLEPAAFAASDPSELALALRALSDKGRYLPRGF
ncbi:hypothetical protein HT031_004180 [Scenedesmus sp. PABB004]|nr:hypothetical protein HT031_004180 [Scenedesmus sp. PABB004]